MATTSAPEDDTVGPPPAKKSRLAERSNLTEAGAQEPVARANTEEANAAKNSSVQPEEKTQKLKPQIDLMPLMPANPPVDASGKRKPVTGLCAREGMRLGLSGPYAYTSKDTKLWPKACAEMFRAQKKTRDVHYASQYIRWWFREHEGLPNRPPKIHRSAYALYFGLQKQAIFKQTGKWTKKDPKKVGLKWKVLDDAAKAPFFNQFKVMQQQHEVNVVWWEEQAAAWRKAKKLRLADEEKDNLKRQTQGLSPLCNCKNCPH